MKKNSYYLFILMIFVCAVGCSDYKKPTLKTINDLLLKPKKKYSKLSGTIVIENSNEIQLQLLEVYMDIIIDGKDVGSFMKKTDAIINPKNVVSVGFYNEINNDQYQQKTLSVEVKLKGYFNGRINNKPISNTFEYKKNVVLGEKQEDEEIVVPDISKDQEKQQKKQEKLMKKNEKDKRKMQNQVQT